MNTDTGKVYRGEESIAAAKARGEKLAPVSEKVAKAMEEHRARQLVAAKALRAQERRTAAKASRRRTARRAIEKASRKANRRRR